MNRFLVFIPLVIPTAFSYAQSFPIVPLSEPVYPEDIPELGGFEWDSNLATLTRLGDLNNDGIDDLVVLFNGSGTLNLDQTKALWIYERDEEGHFLQPTFISGFSLSSHDQVQDFVLNDHNNDGLLDIVFLTDTSAHLVPWLNTGSGFTLGTQLDLPSPPVEPGFGRIEIADLDNNGLNDYILWAYRGDVNAWLNQGTHYIHQSVGNLGSSTNPATQLIIADFDNDQDNDIIASIDPAQLVWIENLENTFSPWQEWYPQVTNFHWDGYFTTFADVNADGLLDLVMNGDADSGYGIGFYLAPFSPEQPREIPYTEFPSDLGETHARDLLSPEYWAERVQSPGDLDGDGTHELLIFPVPGQRKGFRISDPMNLNSRFSISEEYSIHGLGDFGTPTAAYDENLAYQDVYLDVNNDGIKDRIVPTTARKYVDLDITDPNPNGVMLWAMLANPFDIDYLHNPADSIHAPSGMTHIMHTDIDFDGDAEFIMSHSGHLKSLDQDEESNWYHNPDTRFLRGGAGFRTLEAELDTDQGIDLVSYAIDAPTPFPNVYLNMQVGSLNNQARNSPIILDFFELLEPQGISIDPHGGSFAIDDFDNDNDTDICIRGFFWINDPKTGEEIFEGEAVMVWTNNGEADFTLGPISPVSSYYGLNVQFLDSIDHNNDTHPDLVLVTGSDTVPTIEIYTNDGQANMTLAHSIPIHHYNGLKPYWISTSDIDIDGYEDVILIIQDQRDEHELVILYGSPTGISTTPIYLAGKGAAEIIFEDLDGNGLPDMVTCAYECPGNFKNSITIAYQTAPRVFAPMIALNDIYLSGLDYFDVNNDGVKDIIATEYSGYRLPVYRGIPVPCPADLNLDKVLNFFDITLFIQMYTNQRPLADLNHDGILDFFDFSVLLDTFRNGCP